MAAADEDKSSIHSEEEPEVKNDMEIVAEQPAAAQAVAEQPAAAQEADQVEHQQPKMRKGGKRSCPIDWLDQSTLSPSKPLSLIHI